MRDKRTGQNAARGNKAAQEKARQLVTDFLKKKKGTQKQASELFGLSLNGVQRIWRRYKEQGYRGIASKKRGVQGGKKISGRQSAEVRQLIKEKLPDQLKLPFGLWTREAVQQLILNRYGIALSRWQVGRYLKSWGYTPQKPIRKAFEHNRGDCGAIDEGYGRVAPQQVKEWLEKEYPAIKKELPKKMQ